MLILLDTITSRIVDLLPVIIKQRIAGQSSWMRWQADESVDSVQA
jgi:hypothetical protein